MFYPRTPLLWRVYGGNRFGKTITSRILFKYFISRHKGKEEKHLSGYDRQPHFFSSFIFWIYSEGIMP